MSTADSGLKKRNKEKKRPHGEGTPVAVLQRERKPMGPMKLPANETIHLQNDTSIGGSLCSKVVFFISLSLLFIIGSYVFIASTNDGSDNDSNIFASLGRKLINELFPEQIKDEPSDDVRQDSIGVWSLISDFLPFGNDDPLIKNTATSSNGDDNANLANNENTDKLEEESNDDYDDDRESAGDANLSSKNQYYDDDDDDDGEQEDDDDSREIEEESQKSSYDEESEDEDSTEDDSTKQGDENDDDDESENDDSSDEDENECVPDDDECKRNSQKEEPQKDSSLKNVVMKLGVGLALVFVAYSVIIRKWNEYEDLIPDLVAAEERDDINEENAADSEYSDEEDSVEQEANRLYAYEREEDAADWVTTEANVVEQETSDTDDKIGESTNNDLEAELSSADERYPPRNYAKNNITNEYDWRLRDELDDADHDFDDGRVNAALEQYREILSRHDGSVRARYGMARSLDLLAENQKSNRLLDGAIEAYINVLLGADVPPALFELAAARAIDRMRFKGEYENSLNVQNLLTERFPREVKHRNDYVVTLLMLNRISEAKSKLEKILLDWPNNGFALVHYGFVLKLEGKLETAVGYLRRGIESGENGTRESRFYFHLGDALQRLGREQEADKVFEEGVENGLFLSRYQRSLYNVNRLAGRPWWTLKQTTYESFFQKLEDNWQQIRNEGVSLLKRRNRTYSYINESEQLRERGEWKQFELFSRGVKQPQCGLAPITCRLVNDFEPASKCSRGQVKFSVMEPSTHVWPHCGPTNCRLRAHLGLVVPANVTLRVAWETRTWQEGKVMVFDDSFEHEVWHNGSEFRLILIVDVWHPELTPYERKILSPI